MSWQTLVIEVFPNKETAYLRSKPHVIWRMPFFELFEYSSLTQINDNIIQNQMSWRTYYSACFFWFWIPAKNPVSQKVYWLGTPLRKQGASFNKMEVFQKTGTPFRDQRTHFGKLIYFLAGNQVLILGDQRWVIFPISGDFGLKFKILRYGKSFNMS